MPQNTTTCLLRLPEVLSRTGLSESAMRRLIRAGNFPRQAHLGPRTAAWVALEVDDWIAARIAERDQEEGR